MIVFYNVCLALWVFTIFPYLLFVKKYRKRLLDRLGFREKPLPRKRRGTFRIWVHAVSLGEMKACFPLIERIREDLKNVDIVFSSMTETGYRVAEKKKEVCFFLPFDFSWVMKKVVRKVDPDLFILIESDFWFNLCAQLKKNGVGIALINGRISLSSYKNFRKVRSFSRKLFSFVDLFCVQSESDREKFIKLGVSMGSIYVKGNIKFDAPISVSFPLPTSLASLTEKSVIAVTLTHKGEEELLLKELDSFIKRDSLYFLIAPRHQERCRTIEKYLKKNQIPFRKFSEETKKEARIILIDTIGALESCYAMSKVVIMGGSFIKGVGGHNIYEPVSYGAFVIYGPFMDKQKKIVELVEKYRLGKRATLLELPSVLFDTLKTFQADESLLQNLHLEIRGATKDSWDLVKQTLIKSDRMDKLISSSSRGGADGSSLGS